MTKKHLVLAMALALLVNMVVVLSVLAKPSLPNGVPITPEFHWRPSWDRPDRLDLLPTSTNDVGTQRSNSPTQAPDIEVDPPAIAVTLGRGDTATETLTISNTGDAVLNWNLVEDPLRPWLYETPVAGTVIPAGSADVAVVFNAPTAVGVYTTTLRINSNDPDEPQVNVPVTLTVVMAPDIEVDPPAIAVTLGRGDTATETLTISNTGSVALDWGIIEGPSRSWLSETPITGTVTPAGSTDVAVVFNAPSAAGVYTTTLRINSNDPDEPQVDVPVTMTVVAPDIGVNPLTLTVTLNSGDTTTRTLIINNTGDADLNWGVIEFPTRPWLSEKPVTGTIAPSGSANVVITFTAASSAVGVYTTTLRISSNDPDEPLVNVPVTLIVVAPDIEVNPPAFSIMLYSGDTATETLTINNLGNADLNWGVIEFPTRPWLGEKPVTGTIAPLGSTNVVITFTAAPATVGVYTTTLRINSNDPDEPQVDVPVTLTIHLRIYIPLVTRNY